MNTKGKETSLFTGKSLFIINLSALIISLLMGFLCLAVFDISIIVAVLFFACALLFYLNLKSSKSIVNVEQSNDELEKRLVEKETYLKELHHRVKNNLQTVSSLLSLQSRAVQDSKIKGSLKSSQNRVVSMAMVHEMLYKRDTYLSKIEVEPYVRELSEYLIRSIKGTPNNIDLEIDIDDTKLSIDTVIPLGLIINETVTNALKYGIPDDARGDISISLHKTGSEQNRYELHISDDGIGFPEEVTAKTSKSLGLKLIQNLSRQLKGSISRDLSKKGTHYHLLFEEVIEGIETTA